MKYNGVIQRKFALLDNQLVRIEENTKNLSLDAFRDDWVIRSMAERALQVSVEIIIDVAERIIALENAGPVATAGEAIEKLVVLGLLESAEPYRSMVGLRNLIVHQYEIVDPEIVYDAVQNRLADFRAFRDEIDRIE